MLSKEKLNRISELAKKESLSASEKEEQQGLRQEYLETFRAGMRNHIEGIKVVDEQGTDITPEKLKQIQKEKGIHGR